MCARCNADPRCEVQGCRRDFTVMLMAHAGLTHDAPGDDLLLLQQKADAAQAHLERLLGYSIAERFGTELPEPLREAVMQLACWWFENREAASDRDKLLPFGVSEIVNEFRDWSF